ncbi:hypothetical protein RIF29_35938 [Crotalaria pallida]|uniref:Protein kinase domain-containing protein n=1 Tax=Crotalaria pallida TaxID=3830 RepID=A0AAN9HUB3_CROPI
MISLNSSDAYVWLCFLALAIEMIIMSCGCFGASTLKKKRSPSRTPNEIDGFPLDNIRHFSDKELRLATDNYDMNNKIGRGGFGTVFRGTLRDGRQVAVKTLAAGSRQGVREFLTEIKTISHVKHPNLVELIGCCVEGPSRVLVYEYVENNSLDSALLGTRSSNIRLDWRKRAGICMGTARGLAFLHEELVPHIVHRDIKASNILIDRDFNPKIGDFGLAKLFPDDITHISTRIAGTTGYLAPEYAMGGQLTMKADVYSFGVLILEIISGRSSAKANWGGSQKFLLEWAWQLHEEGKLLELVDPDMIEYPEEEVIRYMKVAFFCTQAAASRRPLMSQVVDMLSKNIRLNEKQLTAPGFFLDSGESSRKKTSFESTSYQFSSTPFSITQLEHCSSLELTIGAWKSNILVKIVGAWKSTGRIGHLVYIHLLLILATPTPTSGARCKIGIADDPRHLWICTTVDGRLRITHGRLLLHVRAVSITHGRLCWAAASSYY